MAAWAQRRPNAPALQGYELLEVIPFLGDGRNFVGVREGEGGAVRRALDLSTLTSKKLITPIEEFFIRTGSPDGLLAPSQWRVEVGGLVAEPKSFTISELSDLGKPLGTHLLECAGSTRNSSFGLMSAAQWHGVPLRELLERVSVRASAKRVLVSGVDPAFPATGADGGPRTGWIFGVDELIASGASLALGMNGVPLPRDHGAPMRLMVPGWYGCCWVKWVDTITFLDDSCEPTLQMWEYASRTRQEGMPELARDFRPATIEQCAMPIRVEKWSHEGKVFYRVVGILWGGDRPIEALSIGFDPEPGLVPVQNVRHDSNDTWTLWSHRWNPKRPGQYRIRLGIDGPGIRPWRMSAGYYERSVGIEEV